MNTYKIKYQVSILLWTEYTTRERTDLVKAISAEKALEKLKQSFPSIDSFCDTNFHRLVDIEKIE